MRLESDNMNIPIWEKAMLTKQEAALYSHIGINKLEEMLKVPNCPFVLSPPDCNILTPIVVILSLRKCFTSPFFAILINFSHWKLDLCISYNFINYQNVFLYHFC